MHSVPAQPTLADGFRLSKVWFSHRLPADHAARNRVPERAPGEFDSWHGPASKPNPAHPLVPCCLSRFHADAGHLCLQFQKQLGIARYETAFQLLHKLRAALVASDREPLHGEVEVDEGFIGGPEEGRPGRGAVTKSLVVFGVEIVRYTIPDPRSPNNPQARLDKLRAGRVRINVIPDASASTLIPWCAMNIKKGARVITDGWSAYNDLEEHGYSHRRILQSAKGKKTGAYLPMVHLIVSNLKRWLLGTYKGAVLPHHLPAYLNEFTFRFNRRYWRGPAFHRALGLMVHAENWPEYTTLYGIAKGAPGAWVHPNSPRNAFSQVKPDAEISVAPTIGTS